VLHPALSASAPIYTTGWREALWEYSILPKNTTQCPWPGLERRPLDPETSAITIRTLRLRVVICTLWTFSCLRFHFFFAQLRYYFFIYLVYRFREKEVSFLEKRGRHIFYASVCRFIRNAEFLCYPRITAWIICYLCYPIRK